MTAAVDVPLLRFNSFLSLSLFRLRPLFSPMFNPMPASPYRRVETES